MVNKWGLRSCSPLHHAPVHHAPNPPFNPRGALVLTNKIARISPNRTIQNILRQYHPSDYRQEFPQRHKHTSRVVAARESVPRKHISTRFHAQDYDGLNSSLTAKLSIATNGGHARTRCIRDWTRRGRPKRIGVRNCISIPITVYRAFAVTVKAKGFEPGILNGLLILALIFQPVYRVLPLHSQDLSVIDFAKIQDEQFPLMCDLVKIIIVIKTLYLDNSKATLRSNPVSQNIFVWFISKDREHSVG